MTIALLLLAGRRSCLISSIKKCLFLFVRVSVGLLYLAIPFLVYAFLHNVSKKLILSDIYHLLLYNSLWLVSAIENRTLEDSVSLYFLWRS